LEIKTRKDGMESFARIHRLDEMRDWQTESG